MTNNSTPKQDVYTRITNKIIADLEQGVRSCHRSCNSPQLWSLKFPHPPNRGGKKMCIDEQGFRATIASSDPSVEDRGMVGRELWEEIHRLRQSDGLSISALARRFDLDRKTVRRCLREKQWQPYQREVRQQTQLMEHADFLRERAPQVHYSARILYQELTAQRGYGGSYETVKALLNFEWVNVRHAD
jgi:transposase-like protein